MYLNVIVASATSKPPFFVKSGERSTGLVGDVDGPILHALIVLAGPDREVVDRLVGAGSAHGARVKTPTGGIRSNGQCGSLTVAKWCHKSSWATSWRLD